MDTKEIVLKLIAISKKMYIEFDKLDDVFVDPWQSSIWFGDDVEDLIGQIMELPINLESNWDWRDYYMDMMFENNTEHKIYEYLLQYKEEFRQEFNPTEEDNDFWEDE